MISTTEYEFLDRYNGGYNRLVSAWELVRGAMSNSTPQYLHLDKVRETIDEVFEFLAMESRFENLRKLSGDRLEIDIAGFSLDGNLFQTLDEVERALNNKAFL